MMSEEELRKEAEKIASEKVGWIVHFSSYVIVNFFMVIFWGVTSGWNSFPWFIFMTIGWGIGVAIHFFAVYIDLGWKEKMKIREYEKLKRLQQQK